MIVAICSDIHDNVWKLEAALAQMKAADRLICCGDFCSPFTVVKMAKGFSRPIDAVFGNNDGDRRLLQQKATEAGHFTFHGEFASLEFDGFRIAVTHYPEVAAGLAGGKYDAVLCGHNHELRVETVEGTLMLNPGELAGVLSGKATFLMMDTQTKEVIIHEV